MQDDKRLTYEPIEPEQIDEYQVFFLGDPSSGKSTIIRRMIQPDTEVRKFDTAPTQGLSMHHWETKLPDERWACLHIWDLGTQEIYRPFLRMFMIKPALYVIVLDARNGDIDAQAERWIKPVKNYANSAPVLLIINKVDQNPAVSLSLTDLLKSYPHITGALMCSALSFSQPEFCSHLTHPLLEQITWIDSLALPHPAYKEIRQALAIKTTPYISINSFMELCDTHGISNWYDSMKLLQQLCQQGICFYRVTSSADQHSIRLYKNASSIEGPVILDPEWITKAFCAIVQNPGSNMQNGFIRYSYIQHLLESQSTLHNLHPAESIYDHLAVRFLMQLFDMYGLALPISEEVFYFPSLCRTERSPVLQEYMGDPNVQKFYLEYECLPPEVLYYLIKALHQELDQDNVWRSGARFLWSSDGDSAIAVIQEQKLHLLIRCAGADKLPRMRMTEIRRLLHSVHEKLELAEPNIFVNYEWEGIQDSFPYDDLETMLKAGTESVYSFSFKRLVPIREILDMSDRQVLLKNRKLCTDMARILTRMAEHPTLRDTREDELNITLRDHLWAMGYHIADSRRLKARTERGWIHEADVILMNGDRTPWTVMETLWVKDSAMRHWQEHLRRLLVYYAPFDLPVRFLISYVSCEKDQFDKLMNRYLAHVRNVESADYRLIPMSTAKLDYVEVGNPYLKAVRSSYIVGDRPVTIYHYFILMHGENHALTPNLDSWITEFEAEVTREPAPADPGDSSPPTSDANQAQTSESPDEHTGQDEEGPPASTIYRVVLLGDGEAGKSLVLRRLKEPDCDPTEFPGNVTPGIDIAGKEYIINGKQVRVNYWDFGGQEILHPLHRIFLVRQTLYVILLNTRNDNQDERALFWLRFVQTYAAGAPVILVLNKVDQNQKAELNQKVLMEQFPNIRTVLRLSALTWEKKVFQEHFENKLTEEIGLLLDKHNTFSQQEMQIVQELQNQKDGCKQISLKDFRKICSRVDPGIAPQYIALLNRFNTVGICVFFEEKTETQTQMLLEPEWITKAIYKILEFKNNSEENGIVSHEDIGTLFDADPSGDYGRDDVGFVLNVMRTFGLSYQQPDKNEEFIPMLCQHGEPEEVKAFIESPNTREMKLRYEYLPADVLYRLIVSRRKELDPQKVWRFGAILNRSENCSAVIRREGNTLTVCTGVRNSDEDPHNAGSAATVDSMVDAHSAKNTVEASEYMSALLGELQNGQSDDRTNIRSVTEGRIKERLVGYKYDGQKEYFDLDRLQLAKANQLYYVMSKCRQTPVYIQDILDQTDTSAEREKEDLLKLTLAGCIDIQKDKLFQKVDEDSRNRQLVRRINQHFHILDQTQSGNSGSGDGPGELDAEIRLERDLPWVILEALNIKQDAAKSASNWDYHLDKLMEQYNTGGYRYLLLISYVECEEADFGAFRDYYFERLRNRKPGETWDRPERCDTAFVKGCPQMIHITKADYRRNETTTTVYHFMVHIPGHTTKKKGSGKRAEKAKKGVANPTQTQETVVSEG